MNWHQYLDHTVSSTFVGKSFPHIDTVQYIGYIMRLMIKNCYIYPPFPGILQARTLEWVAISFSNAWKWKVKVKSLSRVQLLLYLAYIGIYIIGNTRKHI